MNAPVSPYHSIGSSAVQIQGELPFVRSLLDKWLSPYFKVTWKALYSFSNHNYLINDAYVLRIPTDASNAISDRVAEERNLKLAYEGQFTLLRIVRFDSSNGVMVSHYLRGHQTLKSDTLAEWDNLANSVKLLKRLHSSSLPFENRYPFDKRLKACLKTLNEKNIHLSNDLQEMIGVIQEHLKAINPSFFEVVPCHNDPSPENFMSDGYTVSLIDWECAGLNDPAWDISHLCAILLLDGVHRKFVFQQYGETSRLFKPKVLFFEPFIHLGSVLWACEQMHEPNPKMPRDFVEKIYHERIAITKQILSSPDYQAACKLLSQ